MRTKQKRIFHCASREVTVHLLFCGSRDDTVAVVTNAREFATNGVLFEEYGVRVIVYVDGHNLGIIREGSETLRMDHPDLRAVVSAAGEADEWFAHPAGFLYCRGSRKAPAQSPSRVRSRDLAGAAERLLG